LTERWLFFPCSGQALQSLYEQMKEKAERAELSRKEQTSLAQAQKQLLEYQKQITSQKIQALEDKYSTLKKAYLGLEVTTTAPHLAAKNPWPTMMMMKLTLKPS